ncbi:hypothetical protein BGZ73_004179 [Actinomortierella ambigua]|nr:hypothetical protein BGZ73_004179 [Actinomortierella ambigua]
MFPVAQDDHDTIPIRVRYVAKDLWIRVNIARNISVQKARDIVLSHCQLTLAPPSAPPSTVDATVADSENTDAHLAPAVSGSPNGKIDRSSQGRSRGASLSTPHSHAKKSHASENGESGTLNHSSRTAKGASKGMMSDYNDRTLDEISIEDSEDDHGRQGSEVEVIELDREDQDDLFTDNDDELPSGTNARHAQSSRPVSPVQQSSAVPLPQSTSMDPIDARRDNPKQQRQRPLKKKRSLMSSGKAFLTKSLSNPSESAREMSDQPPQPQPASRSSSTPSSATTSLINQEPPNSNQKEKRKDSQQCDPDRDVFHKHSRPVDEDEAVTRAEELMARLDMFSESINAFGGVSSDFDYARSITKSNHLESGSHDTNQPQEAQIPPRSKPKRVQSHSSGILGGTDADNLPSTKNQTSNPSSTNYSLTSVANLTHGWAPWRDKNAGKVPTRERPDIGAWAEPNEAKSTRQNKENSNDPTDLQYDSGWRSAFGLFWVSAGHWLDESRQVSSYTIQPNELFELQLRNDYIQLPPPGSDLKYSDHYAEGILFKLSKKSRPVNILTAHGGRESLGVWKERWVVLQGNQLLISRKRKDQVKKTIVIPKPLTITTRGLPQVSRNLFKFTSPDSMSATMIALDISPDSSGKLCFRGSSENVCL